MSRGGCALSTPFAAFHSGVSLLREKDQEAGKVEHPFHFREFQVVSLCESFYSRMDFRMMPQRFGFCLRWR